MAFHAKLFWNPGSQLQALVEVTAVNPPVARRARRRTKWRLLECHRRGVLEIIRPFPLGNCLQLGLVTSYWVEFGKGSVEEIACEISIRMPGIKKGVFGTNRTEWARGR